MSQKIVLPKFNFGFTWLIIIPAGIWAIAGYYLPLFSENLTQLQTWIVTLLMVLMIGVSLALHVLAHLWTAKVMRQEIPNKLTLLIFGDASQSWPEADSSWREIVVSGAGPIMNLLLAGLTYLLWNTQINYFVSLIALCVSGFNAWIFVINLLPTFPMDGGRFDQSLVARVDEITDDISLDKIFWIHRRCARDRMGNLLVRSTRPLQHRNRTDHICLRTSIIRWIKNSNFIKK